MTAKVKRWEGGGQAGYSFFCPGCRDRHALRTEGGPAWTFNGDVERPVFGPSVLVNGHKLTRDAAGEWDGGWELDGTGKHIATVCHSFVGCNGAAPGQIVFLSDSTHELSGHTVDLPDWPAARDETQQEG